MNKYVCPVSENSYKSIIGSASVTFTPYGYGFLKNIFCIFWQI